MTNEASQNPLPLSKETESSSKESLLSSTLTKSNTDEQYERLAARFQVLSNSGRLKVLALLAAIKSPIPNHAIMSLLHIGQSQTSAYLSALEGAGLVKTQKTGNYVLNEINDDGLNSLAFVLLKMKKEPEKVSKP